MKFSLLLIGVVGCAAPVLGVASPDPGLGSSVRAIMRAEVIDPNPVYHGEPERYDGVKAVRSMLRYQMDREKPLISPTSSTKSGAQGTPVNGSGEILNGTSLDASGLDGDTAGPGGGGGGTGGAAGGPSASH